MLTLKDAGAFAPKDKIAELTSRRQAIGAKIADVATKSETLTEEAKAKMRAATDYLAQIDVQKPESQGQILLLEAALGVQAKVARHE